MTNEMLFDIIDRLHRKVKILSVLCIVLAIISTIFVVLFFVEFEVTTEMVIDEDTQVELQQDTGDGSGSNVAIINSDITKDEDSSNAYVWLCVIIGCVAVTISGIVVVIYGTTKNNHKKEKD